MTDEFLTIDVPMSMFSQTDLIGLGAACDLWHSKAEAFAILVFAMTTQEMNRRAWNAAHPGEFRDPNPGRIRPADWSDKDIADAALFCWGGTEHTRDPNFGEFIDAIGNVFVTLACDRLRSSGDPRNLTTFEERNRKESDNGPSEVPEV